MFRNNNVTNLDEVVQIIQNKTNKEESTQKQLGTIHIHKLIKSTYMYNIFLSVCTFLSVD